ncbi:MAG: hypothetical protein Q4G69_08495 [Planctomycetia bacterium]|nr:hypothetical protein [Planctomycetia bacterium]
MKNFVLIGFVLALGLIGMIGCSGNCPVQGTVTYSDDGSPLNQGYLIFDNGKVSGRAEIQSDGTYAAGLKNPGSGLPKGTWYITVLGAEKRAEAKPSKDATGNVMISMKPDSITPLIDEKYKRAETSGLSITVDGSVKKFDLKVDRPKK